MEVTAPQSLAPAPTPGSAATTRRVEFRTVVRGPVHVEVGEPVDEEFCRLVLAAARSYNPTEEEYDDIFFDGIDLANLPEGEALRDRAVALLTAYKPRLPRCCESLALSRAFIICGGGGILSSSSAATATGSTGGSSTAADLRFLLFFFFGGSYSDAGTSSGISDNSSGTGIKLKKSLYLFLILFHFAPRRSAAAANGSLRAAPALRRGSTTRCARSTRRYVTSPILRLVIPTSEWKTS